MDSHPVKPPPEERTPTHGFRWKYREPKCQHGFVLGKGLCPHPGCAGAKRRTNLLHYRASYLKAKDMKAGKVSGFYRCYMCGRLLPDGTGDEPSAFFGATSKRNGHQSRCKRCDNKRRGWRRRYGAAQGGTRMG